MGQYKNWYLAIKQNGHMKNAGKVLRHHKSYQFQVLHENKRGNPAKIYPGFPFKLGSKVREGMGKS